MIAQRSPFTMNKPNVEPEFDIVDVDMQSMDSTSRDRSKILTHAHNLTQSHARLKAT